MRPFRVQDNRMRRFAAAISFVFVTSLVLASYGHCWPMLQAQIDSATAAHADDHGGHHKQHKQHNHQAEGFGQELTVPGVPSGPVAFLDAPVAKTFAPILLVVAISEGAGASDESPSPRARAGPPAFAEFHARTGRLLI
jgi:hypothetical protein